MSHTQANRISNIAVHTGVMVANPEDIDIDEGDEDEEMAEPGDAVEEKAVPVGFSKRISVQILHVY